MFIHVRLLKGFPKPLTYKVPELWPQHNLVGHIVHVPIQKRTEHALVIEQSMHHPAVSFAIKEALALEPFPLDPNYHTFIEKLSDYHQLEPLHFFRRMRSFIEQEKESIRAPRVPVELVAQRTQTVTLTTEQQAVTDFVIKHIHTPAYTPTVLHGVTGSGKTECYKKMICAALERGKSALLLLPEVTLALQFEQIMRAQLPESIIICAFHSAATARDKKVLWKHVLEGTPLLIIGVHLPVLLPITNLGLIIVDEEHEVGYQEKKHPKINSKEAALIRAQLVGIPIVLGSATPSITSLYNVKKRGWHFFQLKHRFAGAFPDVKTVFLSDKKYRRNFWISQELENGIRDRLEKHEQTIIFINRRGFSFFVQCKECGFIFECPNCSVSLTLHDNNTLTCHYCEHTRTLPQTCPGCKNEHATFIKKGIGTQQVVAILEKLFPYAKIGRADQDATRKKTTWHETLCAFENRQLDILVGTQTITKGFHFPGVTLVGILWADLNLHFPVYNATETTLQQLIQVAGRAGRQSSNSLVIVQAMGDHPVFKYLNEIDYPQFYADEIENRHALNYPPHGRLAEIELKHTNETIVQRDAEKLTEHLLAFAKQKNLAIRILGPALPPVSKIKQTHIRKIYLKGADLAGAKALWQAASKTKTSSQLFFTPNCA